MRRRGSGRTRGSSVSRGRPRSGLSHGLAAPDAGAGEETEPAEAPVVPRQPRGDGEDEVDTEGDREQDLPPGTIREEAEDARSCDRTEQVEGPAGGRLLSGEMERVLVCHDACDRP